MAYSQIIVVMSVISIYMVSLKKENYKSAQKRPPAFTAAKNIASPGVFIVAVFSSKGGKLAKIRPRVEKDKKVHKALFYLFSFIFVHFFTFLYFCNVPEMQIFEIGISPPKIRF